MSGTTIMIAAAAAGAGYLYWHKLKHEKAVRARATIHRGGTGTAYSLPSNAGHLPVAQAGGIGAGAGAPTETKAVVSTTKKTLVAEVRKRMPLFPFRPTK
jgi:hypothetical protein